MKINCIANKCVFNENNICIKKQIEVEGLYARYRKGTFCISFTKEQKENIEPKTSRVICNANNCKYNKNGFCFCEELNIFGDNANYRSETECHSFEVKKR